MGDHSLPRFLRCPYSGQRSRHRECFPWGAQAVQCSSIVVAAAVTGLSKLANPGSLSVLSNGVLHRRTTAAANTTKINYYEGY